MRKAQSIITVEGKQTFVISLETIAHIFLENTEDQSQTRSGALLRLTI